MKTTNALLITLLATALTACGGGGGTDTPANNTSVGLLSTTPSAATAPAPATAPTAPPAGTAAQPVATPNPGTGLTTALTTPIVAPAAASGNGAPAGTGASITTSNTVAAGTGGTTITTQQTTPVTIQTGSGAPAGTAQPPVTIPVVSSHYMQAPVTRHRTDQPDTVQGAQIHLIYAVPQGGVDRAFDLSADLVNTTGSWNNWMAGQTGGRRIRVDMTDALTPDVTFVQLNVTDAALEAYGARKRDQIEAEIAKQVPQQPNKIYVVYYDGTNPRSCADAPHPPQLPGHTVVVYMHGLENTGYLPCWQNGLAVSQTARPGYLDMVVAHEILHALGFVDYRAPNNVFNGHVNTDPTDLMYAGTAGWNPQVLDYNHSNYYNPNGLPNGLLNFNDSPYLTAQ